MKATKFHRKRDQREALIQSLAESLLVHGSIETTLPKAKSVARYTEKLVNKAKRGKKELHQRRLVIAALPTAQVANKLVDEIAPMLSRRSSGYFRVKRKGLRHGDGSQMAEVSFVDEIKSGKSPESNTKIEAKTSPENQKIAEETVEIDDKSSINPNTSEKKLTKPAGISKIRRTGRRGNR